MSADLLPVHFLTIVLNGEPFLRFHIDVFRRLPFRWHWHIVEGLAALNHDTAWSVGGGGCITAGCHRGGKSIDGTTGYLDDLQALYPGQVSVYRKPDGILWDGKKEMVNAPLPNIQEECLLWEVDADELWTAEQITTGRQLFLRHPKKTAAYYWCQYFVGENLIVRTRNCYSQNPRAEWLRTWRYRPGMRWSSHEPPRLVDPQSDAAHVGAIDPFLHAETETAGLVFQHFAYVTPEQLRFKENYYGYANALAGWTALQRQTEFPQLLRRHFSWVKDHTEVDTAANLGIVPLARKVDGSWRFDAAAGLGLTEQAAQVARLTHRQDRLAKVEQELKTIQASWVWDLYRGWSRLKSLVRPIVRRWRAFVGAWKRRQTSQQALPPSRATAIGLEPKDRTPTSVRSASRNTARRALLDAS